MKRILMHLIVFGAAAGCTIDNYKMPELTITGKIMDAQTNELVESGGINAGTLVRLFEGESVQPLTYNTFPNGTFVNGKVFPGKYSYTAEGPFKLVSAGKQSLEINGNSEIEIKVTPNVRIKTTVSQSSGNTATVKLSYEKLSTDQALTNLGLTWSTYPNPNMLIFPGGNTILETVEPAALAKGERTFTLSNLKPNTTYYLRGAGRTVNPGNYYNYSPQIEIKTN